jgi:murein DD-endopeptidase MepM/ murein hydrolase activator NlpD
VRSVAEKRQSTIIIVPHAHGKVFKLQLSPALLRTLIVLGITVAVLSIVSIAASGTFLHQRAVYRTLQAENKQLKKNNQRLAETVTQVQARLTQFEQRTKTLAIAAGVADLFSENADNSRAGIGSGGPLDRLSAAPETLVRRQEQLDQQLAKVERKLSEQALMLSHTPVVAPVIGVITDGFGPRLDPVTRRPAFHDGLDISVAIGTVVTAPADGVVVFADRESGYGRMLKINHGYGYTTVYGHLERFLVKEGAKVTRGQPIGKVGMSGRTTGPHLHYEVWKDGEKQNPLHYILDAY